MTEIPQDVLKRFEEVRRAYDAKAKKANFLVYGPSGAGKTYSLRTAVLPIHIDSFDPGGPLSLSDVSDGPGWFVDRRWEHEDDFAPKVWANWTKDFEERVRIGYFKYVATYVVDSFTLWVETALNAVKANKSGGVTQPEYNLRLIRVRKYLKDILDLPCNVIIISHPFYEKDEVRGKMYCAPFAGKMGIRLPPMFDEIYYAAAEVSSKGVDYSWKVRPQTVEPARSRLIKGGDASLTSIEPNFKAALKRAGYPAEDLQPPSVQM